MYLTGAVEYSVQIGRTRSSSFEWLFPLTGFRASESGFDRHVFGIFIIASTLVFVASGPTIAFSGFGSARVTGTIAASG